MGYVICRSHLFIDMFLNVLHLLALFILTQPYNISQTSSDPAIVYLFSNDPSLEVYQNIVGGVLGGTKLYIWGWGFDDVPENNLVRIGSSPCKVTEANSTNIVCVSEPSEPSLKQFSVSVKGKDADFCDGCYFQYSLSVTPSLQSIYPRSGTYYSRAYFLGNHKQNILSKMVVSEVNSLKIGDYACSLDEIIQEVRPIDSPLLLCDVSNKEGGFYNVSSWLISGYSRKSPAMLVQSMFEENLIYQYTLHPIVTSVSQHSGSSQGNQISITGTGFSLDTSKIEVQVAGLPCHVTTSTHYIIECTVGEDFNRNTYGRLEADSRNQQNGFISGSGFLHQIYDVQGLDTGESGVDVNDFRKSYLNGSKAILKQAYSNVSTRGVLGELELRQLDFYDLKGTNNGNRCFGSVSRGYFVAPKTQQYKFQLISIRDTSIYASKVKGSTQIEYSQQFLKSRREQMEDKHLEYKQKTDPSMTSQVSMQAGQSMYLQIFSSTCFQEEMKISILWSLNVQASSDDPAHKNKVGKVQKIEVTAEYEIPVLVFEHIGATTGTFQYEHYTKKYYCPFNATALQFIQQCFSKSLVEDYQLSAEVQIYDYNSILTNISNNSPYRYRYTLTINNPTSDPLQFTVNNHNASNQVNTSTIPSVSFQTLKHPSFDLFGTIDFLIKSPSNPNPNLQTLLMQSRSTQDLKVILYSFGAPGKPAQFYSSFNRTLVIEFEDAKDYQIQVTSSNLTGGKEGTTPQVKVTTLRELSNNILYHPIPSEFLRTPSSTPSVIVKVNKAISQCMGDCSYTISNDGVPNITAASLDGGIISVTLDTDIPIPYDVTFAGQPCTYVSGNYQSYKCSLPRDLNENPILESGSYLPKVLIQNKGFCRYAQGLAQIYNDLTINSLTPSSGSPNGGMILKMNGKGFPTGLDRIFSIKMCGKDINPLSVSSHEIQFYSVQCTDLATQVKLQFNGIQAETTYTYTAAPSLNISSIQPQSSSPVSKSFMTVKGVGFGTDKSLLKAWLTNNDVNIYQLTAVSANDTTLRLIVPKGKSGQFRLKVFRTDVGAASVSTVDGDKFVFGIFVDSISPTIGSEFGGTILTIEGQNFGSNHLDYSVHIGDDVNNRCQVLTATNTSITCRTSPLPQNSTKLSQEVVVVGRGGINSSCLGSCQFTYDNTNSPRVSQIVKGYSYYAGESVDITGTGFLNEGVSPKVFVGDKEALVTHFNDTDITFTFPGLYYGEYPLLVQVHQVGYASASQNLKSNLGMNSTEFNSSILGHSFSIIGSGFLPLDPYVLSELSTSIYDFRVEYIIHEITPTEVKLEILSCDIQKPTWFSIGISNQSFFRRVNIFCSLNYTPVVVLDTPLRIPYNSLTQPIKFNQTTKTVAGAPQLAFAYLVDADNRRFGEDISLNIQPDSGSEFTLDGTRLSSGRYSFKFFYQSVGNARSDSILEITQTSTPTVTAVESGYNGGPEIKVAGAGLNLQSKLIVGGRVQAVMDRAKSTSTELYYTAPPYFSKLTYQQFGLMNETKLVGDVIASNMNTAKIVFDNSYLRYYVLDSPSDFIGFDFGNVKRAVLTRMRYYLNFVEVGLIPNFQIKGSNNNEDWVTIGRVSGDSHKGWNTYKPSTLEENQFLSYRYITIRRVTRTIIFQLQLYGFFVSEPLDSLDSNTFNLDFSNGFHTHQAISTINYKSNLTPIVSDISLAYGTTKGGQTLLITGTNFGTSVAEISVLIDSVPCSVTSTTTTQIVCTTGQRQTIPQVNSFSVSINANNAIIQTDPFLYGHRWSDEDAWGDDYPPIENDTVHVPQGTTLIVDRSTLKLQLILVEGTLIFADEQAMTVQAETILIIGGRFRIGTQQKPYQNHLTLILSGNAESKDLSMFGNKVIGCYNCQLDIHGKKRDVIWTELNSTADVGTTSIKLIEAVDWTVGDKIVISSTSFDHTQSEERVIAGIDSTNKIITFTKPLFYSHQSTSEQIGTYTVALRGEVGLLTRNIQIKGDTDSSQNKHGCHVMMFGYSVTGLVSRIQYTEFSGCGQQQTGKPCINFDRNGDLSSSYVIGNSVHNSFLRVVGLKECSHLRIVNNIGYLVGGHNIFLGAGRQLYNIIQNNLMISPVGASSQVKTEVFPSSFYISNPLNTVRNNKAVGSEGHGFNYYFGYPTVAIYLKILQILDSSNNTAHSNQKGGLKIYKANFSDQGDNRVFSNYSLWNNGKYGVYMLQSQNIILTNFTVINFKQTGIYTLRGIRNCGSMITVSNSLIASPVTESESAQQSVGILLQDGKYTLTNIQFVHFPVNSVLMKTQSFVTLLFDTQQNINYLKQISTLNVSGKYIDNSDTNYPVIFRVLDHSLSVEFGGVERSNFLIVRNTSEYNTTNSCWTTTDALKWGQLMMCSSDREISVVIIVSPDHLNYKVVTVPNDFETPSPSANIPNISQNLLQISAYIVNLTLFSGDTYAVWNHLSTGVNSFFISTGCSPPPTKEAILLRYNYTDTYYYFTVEIDKEITWESQSPLNKSTCEYGDYYSTKGYLFICISARGWKPQLKIDVVPVVCYSNCPDPNQQTDIQCGNQKKLLKWSDSTIWTKRRLPIAGESITIPIYCNILMDVNVQNVNILKVDGSLTIKDSNLILSAKFIWVAGLLQAGTEAQPFQNNLTIRLLGPQSDPTFKIDTNIQQKKSLFVSGTLKLYGKVPTTPNTRLTHIARADDTQINVQSTKGWKIGQTVGISPSFGNFYEYQKVTITDIFPTAFFFTPPLKYNHYAALTPLTNTQGQIDMRTVVALLDRNIKIVNDDDSEDWSYSVLVRGWNNSGVIHSGSAIINSVQFKNGGQFSGYRAALSVYNTDVFSTSTLISNSVFESCLNYCVFISNVSSATVHNNLFFEGQGSLMHVKMVDNFSFTNNVLVGARNRTKDIADIQHNQNTGLISCYHQLDPDSNFTVTNNVCQGSQEVGFIIPFVACDDLNRTKGYSNNTAGSAQYGFVVTSVRKHEKCQIAGNMKAYGCDTGIDSGPSNATIVWDQLMLADNKIALSQTYVGGTPSKNLPNNIFLKNSWISEVSRTDCKHCYQDGQTSCSNLNALRLFVVNQNRAISYNDSTQLISSPSELHANAWIDNVVFENFRLNYTSLPSATLAAKCYNNRLFEVHLYADSSIANHHFTNTKCIGCDADSYGYFNPPIQADLESRKCGNILCTGRNNYLMLDHDGGLLGSPGTLTPNNPLIASLPNCTFNIKTNGYVCNRTDIGRLKFESIAMDFMTRIMWPVSLTKEGTNITTVVSGWKDDEWIEGHLVKKRLGKFLSLIQYGHSYNISFTAQPPSDMLFSFSLSSLQGDNSKWACIKLYYPISNCITVTHANGSEPKYIVSTNPQEVTDFTQLCGAHKYFYKQSIIHFVVTADPNCFVRVTLTSSMLVTVRLSIENSEFYLNNGMEKFIDQIVTLLKIERKRIKIVGIYAGSTIVDFTINSYIHPIQRSNQAQPDSSDRKDEFNRLSKQLSAADTNDIPHLLGITSTTTMMNVAGQHVGDTPVQPQPEPKSQSNKTGIIVGSVIGGVVFIALMILAICLIIRCVNSQQAVRMAQGNPNMPYRLETQMNINPGSEFINMHQPNSTQLRPMI